MSENIVAQLHQTLVDALRKSRPNSLHRPVTVAEIYQDLVPYRTARNAVGFEMNADYEHTLLRLLAGEGDLARIEPREVRDKLRMELDSPNPDVSLYRNYAACDVWVSIEDGKETELDDSTDEDVSWEEEFVGPPAPAKVNPHEIQAALVLDEEPRFELADEEVDEDEPDDEFEDELEEEFEEEDDFDDDEEESVLDNTPEPVLTAVEATQKHACAFCGSDLPADRMVNFCPFCGSDQSQQPCPSCGEMLDPLWRFCIACGARVQPLGDHLN